MNQLQYIHLCLFTLNEGKVIYKPKQSVIHLVNNPCSKKIDIVRLIAAGRRENSSALRALIITEFITTSLKTVVPEKLRFELKEAQTIEAQTFLSKRLSTATGRIDLILTVTDLVSRKEKEINEEEVKALELMQQKANAGYKDAIGPMSFKMLLLFAHLFWTLKYLLPVFALTLPFQY